MRKRTSRELITDRILELAMETNEDFPFLKGKFQIIEHYTGVDRAGNEFIDVRVSIHNGKKDEERKWLHYAFMTNLSEIVDRELLAENAELRKELNNLKMAGRFGL